MNTLHYGFVKLIQALGDDSRIAESARVSYSGGKKINNDENLIKYLWNNEHGTPFESVVFQFHIKCPIFVARQWFRHRIASYNEISGRYVVMKDEFFIPPYSRLTKQSKSNKQGSSDELIDNPELALEIFNKTIDLCYNNYQKLLELGLAKELARTILPLNLYTEFYWTVNLRSLFNFIELRTGEHAQQEIKEYAKIILELIKQIVPVSVEAFLNKKSL